MKATESSRPFPIRLVVSLGIPIACALLIALLAAVRSEFAIVAAFFSAILIACGLVIGLMGIASGERPRWLLYVTLVVSALVLYAFTLIGPWLKRTNAADKALQQHPSASLRA